MIITARELDAIAGVRHGFFTRRGGHSTGIYASLNTGLGSKDHRPDVDRNRIEVKAQLDAKALVTPYQIHSAVAVHVQEPWDWKDAPKADAVVTDRPGLAVAVNTADCTPVLFADVQGKCVGAAHSGWKGAIGGILEATVEAMERLGAGRSSIHAVIGPTISQSNYEVGPEFHDRFCEAEPANARFFVPSGREGHFMFDLPGYVTHRLTAMKLAGVADLATCTYAHDDRFFSYRRMTHRGEPDYGRQMSAVMLGG